MKPLLRALSGDAGSPPPIWLMRQAGRYLPEYRATRAQANGFLDLCFTPDLAVEVTLQPIRRYGFDAAILFSDILVIPHGLGQKVWFEEGHGPKLSALNSARDLDALSLSGLHEALAPVYETVRRLAKELPSETTLIGFSGAPWTLACYMVEGAGSKDFAKTRAFAYSDPKAFQRLIDLLIEATSDYLCAQIEAGAEALQVFDSWAGVLPEQELRRWVLAANSEVVARVKARHPKIPIILFPRGSGLLYREFARHSGADALSLDVTVPLEWARDELQADVVLQGNLDPLMLVAGGDALIQEIRRIVDCLGTGPFIFNLGHGIVPQTDPGNVAALIEAVRSA